MIASAVALQLIGSLSPRTYFLAAFVWLLIVSELFAPESSDIDWWQYLQWVKVGGGVVLAYLVVERVLAVV